MNLVGRRDKSCQDGGVTISVTLIRGGIEGGIKVYFIIYVYDIFEDSIVVVVLSGEKVDAAYPDDETQKGWLQPHDYFNYYLIKLYLSKNHDSSLIELTITTVF